LVLRPELAMESMYGLSCFSVKGSSSNFLQVVGWAHSRCKDGVS
jgi:hypothetical protein